jgi:hypothetical protein
MLNTEKLRLRDAGNGAFALTCVDCEHVGLILAAVDLHLYPLATIIGFGEHPCRAAEIPGPPATPRGDDTPMRAFIAETLTPDTAGVVRLDRLVDDWEAQTGQSIDAGYFTRRLRAALPAGAAIRREMIGGIRARRLVGMRLK